MCRRSLEFATRIHGVLEEIPEVAHWLDEIAASNGLAEPVAFAIQVCAEEILSNIVRHGGRRLAAGPGGKRSQTTLVNVSVKVSIEPTMVRLTVEDDGKPFDVAAAEAHRIDRPLDEVEPGGLGIQLIKSFANHVTYERAGLGNRVVIEVWRGEQG